MTKCKYCGKSLKEQEYTYYKAIIVCSGCHKRLVWLSKTTSQDAYKRWVDNYRETWGVDYAK